MGFDLHRLCGGGLMPPKRKNIESVRIFTSETNVFNGKNVGPGLAVIIDPMPANKDDIIQICDDIRAAVMAYNGK